MHLAPIGQSGRVRDCVRVLMMDGIVRVLPGTNYPGSRWGTSDARQPVAPTDRLLMVAAPMTGRERPGL